MYNLNGKVAIITGAAQGMGESHARRLAEEGAMVILTDIKDEQGEAVARSIGENARYCHLDVSDENQWNELGKMIGEKYGHIDILVNNAGIATFESIEEISTATFLRDMSIDAYSVFYSVRAVLPYMKEGGGSIINISSIDGLVGEPDSVSYVASKFAVTGLTKTIAMDLVKYNIRVNSIHPGAVATDIVAAANDAVGLTDAVNPFELVPMKRAADPQEISNLVAFLASEQSSYITGAQLVIDGGKLCTTNW